MNRDSTSTKFHYIMKAGDPIQSPKTVWEKWIFYSAAINKAQPLEFLLPIIHWLGFLDMQLREWEPQFFSQPPAPINSEIIKDNYRIFESYLWVLSAYEMIRTLSQKASENEEIFGADVTTKIRETKHKLEEVRIPLAKLEPRKLRGETALAFPSKSKDSFGWTIEPGGKYCSRRELADAVLDLLKFMHENDKDRQAHK